MKTSITIATFAGIISAVSGQYFGVTAAHASSPIHLLPWSASGERIWIGKSTACYCPSEEVTNCPAGKSTNFAGGNVSLAMGAEVPGGQFAYIDPACGALMYTQAHSAAMPVAAIVDGWTLDQGESYGFLAWKNGLLACSKGGDADTGPWEIYAQLDGIEFGAECIGLDAITTNETAPAAWEYT